MIFFTVGYIIVWILVLAYTGLIHKEQNKLRQEITLLEELVYERQR